MANSASGMSVSDYCKQKFMELKRKKTYQYIIFMMDEKFQQITLEKTGAPGASCEDFTAQLPENNCRYGIYDFDFTTEDNCRKRKIFFIAWSPDTSLVKAKMMYASSKDCFWRELDGVHYELQATDASEMDMDVIRDRAN